jgi:hypothetical protein
MKRLLLFLLFCTCAFGQEEALKYHPLTIAQVVAENPAKWSKMHTHIVVEGYVTYTKIEEDGDLHIRLCDSPAVVGMDRAHCMVAELIPNRNYTMDRAIKKRERIRVAGVSRYDAERNHNWWEIHPIAYWEHIQ